MTPPRPVGVARCAAPAAAPSAGPPAAVGVALLPTSSDNEGHVFEVAIECIPVNEP